GVVAGQCGAQHPVGREHGEGQEDDHHRPGDDVPPGEGGAGTVGRWPRGVGGGGGGGRGRGSVSSQSGCGWPASLIRYWAKVITMRISSSATDSAEAYPNWYCPNAFS